jgi:hypothetical protein
VIIPNATIKIGIEHNFERQTAPRWNDGCVIGLTSNLFWCKFVIAMAAFDEFIQEGE